MTQRSKANQGFNWSAPAERTPYFVFACVACALVILAFPFEALARVGGGQSYGGGGGGGSGGGGGGAGAIIWLILQLVRLLLYLTIEYPIVGIPLDIIVIAGVIYYFMRRTRTVDSEIVSVVPQGPSEGAGALSPTDASRVGRSYTDDLLGGELLDIEAEQL